MRNLSLLLEIGKRIQFSFIITIDLRNGEILKQQINNISLPVNKGPFLNQIQTIINIYDQTCLASYPVWLQFPDLQIMLTKDRSNQILFCFGFHQFNSCIRRAVESYITKS